MGGKVTNIFEMNSFSRPVPLLLEIIKLKCVLFPQDFNIKFLHNPQKSTSFFGIVSLFENMFFVDLWSLNKLQSIEF